jgi:hypothetical protein
MQDGMIRCKLCWKWPRSARQLASCHYSSPPTSSYRLVVVIPVLSSLDVNFGYTLESHSQSFDYLDDEDRRRLRRAILPRMSCCIEAAVSYDFWTQSGNLICGINLTSYVLAYGFKMLGQELRTVFTSEQTSPNMFVDTTVATGKNQSIRAICMAVDGRTVKLEAPDMSFSPP